MKVSARLGYTKNLGNFESLRIELGIEIDNDDYVSNAHEELLEVLSQKIQDNLPLIENKIKPKGYVDSKSKLLNALRKK